MSHLRKPLEPFDISPRMTCNCDEEVAPLYAAMRSLPSEAITTLRERVGEAIDIEVRD